MTEEDLPQVRKLNNQFEDAVGLVTKAKLLYLFDNSYYPLVVRDQDRVVAFLLSHASGLDYNSKNYIWHSDHAEDPNFIYIDRVVVH